MTQEMENIFQDKMSKKQQELDELRHSLDELLAKPPVEKIVEVVVEKESTDNSLKPKLDALQTTFERDPNLYYEDGYQELVNRGVHIATTAIGDVPWIEVDTLEDLARYPIGGYGPRSRGGQIIARTLREHGLEARYVVSASDTDVIKAYVAEGLGIAIIPSIAYDPDVVGFSAFLWSFPFFLAVAQRIVADDPV